MGFTVLDQPVEELDACVGKEMLALITYPAAGKRCFFYPRYVMEGDALTPVAASAFPDVGCLPATTADITAAEFERNFGRVGVMTVNDRSNELRHNNRYPDSERHLYNSIVNPGWNKPAVDFVPLARHSLSGRLMQVLEVQEQLDVARPPQGSVHLYSGQLAPQTKLALVAQGAGASRRLLGPFECSAGAAGELALQASEAYDSCVAAIPESMLSFAVTLSAPAEAAGEPDAQAAFVSAAEYRELFDASPDDVRDWISDDALLEAMGRISRRGADALTKAQARSLRARIAECTEEDARFHLTPARRARMLSLLGIYEDWSSLPEELRGEAIEKASPEQLAEYVLEDEHFKGFYDKVLENDRVRQRVEQAKARYAEEERRCAADAQAARELLDEARAELRSYQEAIAEKRAALEAEMATQVAEATRRRDELSAEVARLADERARLEEGVDVVRRQIREAVDGVSDELAASGEVIRGEVLRQVVESVQANRAADEGDARGARAAGANGRRPASATPPVCLLRPDDLGAAEVLDQITAYVNERGGRDMSENEVANLMTCLTQGYVTTLAGLPGTGKTSLANIIAAALGLTSTLAPRFVEVPVERGWTSYKDFVGYYNPLTHTVEKSSAEAFDAFARLDAEARAGVGAEQTAPFVFLLDEANLSSMEHYWAPFLRACDAFAAGPTRLSLGGDCSFAVPSYVRFVATVNFDHTTEELSPRFLDRSWVITLDPAPMDLEEVRASAVCDDELMPAFSHAALWRAFGPRADVRLDADLRAKLREVLDACDRHGRPVSPRSRNMMAAYARTASELMDRQSRELAYAPVDYAVTQKVLPQLSGTEERLRPLLSDLAVIGGLPLMQGRVRHMLEAGDGSGYYQYFA